MEVNSYWSLNEWIQILKRKEKTLSCVYLLQKTLYWKSCVVLNFVQLQQRKCNTCAEFLFSLIKTLLCSCCGDNLKLSIYTMINGSSNSQIFPLFGLPAEVEKYIQNVKILGVVAFNVFYHGWGGRTISCHTFISWCYWSVW